MKLQLWHSVILVASCHCAKTKRPGSANQDYVEHGDGRLQSFNGVPNWRKYDTPEDVKERLGRGQDYEARARVVYKDDEQPERPYDMFSSNGFGIGLANVPFSSYLFIRYLQ